jgi:hypothetical protein
MTKAAQLGLINGFEKALLPDAIETVAKQVEAKKINSDSKKKKAVKPYWVRNQE